MIALANTEEVPLSAVEQACERLAGARAAELRSGPKRARSGIVHTPPSLARFVVQSAHAALVEHFGCAPGFADRRLVLIDPACGPGVFIASALGSGSGSAHGSRPGQLIGFDVDERVIESARCVLEPAARQIGWPLELRCTDTLTTRFDFDADAIVVVFGNPPWSSRSQNRGDGRMEALLDDFRRDGFGVRLAERRIGVLSDDYVRFWRWSAEIVRQARGGGVVVLVTNGSFLDGPVHRGMRAALSRWFDRMDVLDLGGNGLVARSDGDDENVFGVRPSVAVTIATRLPRSALRSALRIRHARMRGDRATKVAQLERHAFSWATLTRTDTGAPFCPAPKRHRTYEAWISLADAMPFHREGVQTNRDVVVVDTEPERLLDRLRAFSRGEKRADLALVAGPKDHYDPNVAARAVTDVLERDPDGTLALSIRPIAYRPFDRRWFAPIAPFCHRPRPALLEAIDRSGVVLLSVRKDRGEVPWRHFGVCREVPDNCWLSSRSSCRTRAFPASASDGAPNLARHFASAWSDRLGEQLDANAFVYYSLAVLASPTYQRAFDEALRTDYPRIPPPPDVTSFRDVVGLGQALAAVLLSPLPGDEPVDIGHRRVLSADLGLAIGQCDALVRSLL